MRGNLREALFSAGAKLYDFRAGYTSLQEKVNDVA